MPYLRFHSAFFGLFLLLGISSCRSQQPAAHTSAASATAEIKGRGTGTAYAFPFFYGGEGKDRDQEGMWMAISKDGLNWKVVNHNQVVFKMPFPSFFRDPAIYHGPDGTYHLVWTIERGYTTKIGYARSKDLLTWEDTRLIDLMGSVPGTGNVWAPELFYDEPNQRWMIYWASWVEGKFQDKNAPAKNDRMYCAFSKDLKTFSAPQVLFADHVVNDTRIVNMPPGSPQGKYAMVVKHIRKTGSDARLYLAYAQQLEGPYKAPSDSLTYISEPYRFCEGPALIRIGNYYYCYFDLSREKRMACKRNQTLTPEGWEDMTDQLTFPAHVKHGDVLHIPLSIYEKLDAL